MPMNNYSDPSLADQKFTFDETGLTNPQYVVPRAFNQLLDGSNVPVARRYYWYRSQVTHRGGDTPPAHHCCGQGVICC